MNPKPANLYKRFYAFLIDYLFSVIFAILITYSCNIFFSLSLETLSKIYFSSLIFFILFKDIICINRSLGKKICRLKISAIQNNISIQQLIFRNLILCLWPFGFLEGITIYFNDNKQRFMEKYYKTIVEEDTDTPCENSLYIKKIFILILISFIITFFSILRLWDKNFKTRISNYLLLKNIYPADKSRKSVPIKEKENHKRKIDLSSFIEFISKIDFKGNLRRIEQQDNLIYLQLEYNYKIDISSDYLKLNKVLESNFNLLKKQVQGFTSGDKWILRVDYYFEYNVY